MRTDTAKQVILSLLAEKDVCLPEDADMRILVAHALECGLLPEGLAPALTETFNAAAYDSTGTGRPDRPGTKPT